MLGLARSHRKYNLCFRNIIIILSKYADMSRNTLQIINGIQTYKNCNICYASTHIHKINFVYKYYF
jgi:hypothetical protein